MITNKVTEIRIAGVLTAEDIQTHIDTQNEGGWYLICLDNLSGWYRFFWAKES